jgi:hypothetical protein
MENFLVEEFIAEAKQDKEGKVYLEGIYAMSESKNQNGRIYPKGVLDREMKKYINEQVQKNRAYGELAHPSVLTINPDNISHRIVELHEDGNYWKGKSIVLDTPKGNIIKALVKDGGIVGMSTRAVGSLKPSSDGCKIVQEDLKMKTIDAVLDPSAKEALMNAIFESKETFYCENEQCYMLVEDIKNKVRKASHRDLEKTILESWERYCKFINL